MQSSFLLRSVLASALAVGALVALEAGLRATGLGARPRGTESALTYQHVPLPVLAPARLPDGRAVLATRDARLPFQWIEDRPAGAPRPLRVACFGGSATAGLGVTPNGAFPRMLEELLLSAGPGRPVEVLNLGVVALHAGGVRAMVEDLVARHELDAVVVMSGNNEFLELHSERYFEAHASVGRRLHRALHATNLCGLVRGRPEASADRTLDDLAAARGGLEHRELMGSVRLAPGDVERVLDRYEAELTGIAAATEAAGVPLFLCAVPVNLRWWALADPDPTWRAALDDEAALAAARARRAAVDPVAEGAAEELRLWSWWEGELALALGRRGEAAAAFGASLEVDRNLRRATAAHAARVERAARTAPGARFVDLPAAFAADAAARAAAGAGEGVVGWDLFYDYVHFRPEGALLVATELLGALDRAGVVALGPGRLAAAMASEGARIAELTGGDRDALDAGAFLGFGADPVRLADRDLWKLLVLEERLDGRLATDPGDRDALVWRGHLSAYRRDGAAAAERDYRAALALGEDPVLRAALASLLGDRRPRVVRSAGGGLPPDSLVESGRAGFR